jgi:NAD(P)-dependent dehydrogenase (short-subunit alcohol dehydrogenase family)
MSCRSLCVGFAQTLTLLVSTFLSCATLLLGTCACCRARASISPSSILITGATGGLGEELSLQYARALGARVSLALTGRNAAALERIATACRALGARVRTLRADVLSRAELAAFVAEVDAAAPLDLVIANAGVTERTAGVVEGDIEGGTRACFSVNVDGVFNTVFPALPAMRERRRGQIAVISSIASFNAFSAFDGYSASKGAIRMWAESLRHKLFREGVLVSCVCPGYIDGAMTQAFAGKLNLMGMVTQAHAASQVIAGLARDESLIAFPTTTFLLSSSLLAALPHAARDLLARSHIFSEYKYS